MRVYVYVWEILHQIDGPSFLIGLQASTEAKLAPGSTEHVYSDWWTLSLYNITGPSKVRAPAQLLRK